MFRQQVVFRADELNGGGNYCEWALRQEQASREAPGQWALFQSTHRTFLSLVIALIKSSHKN